MQVTLSQKEQIVPPRDKASRGTPDAANILPSHVQVTVTGPASHVQNLLAGFGSQEAQLWNLTTARQIALVQTLVETATMEDALNGERLKLGNPTALAVYLQRCVDASSSIGVSITLLAFQKGITGTSKVQEVGDALWSAGL